MYLKHLSLTNFRNFTRLDVDIPRRVVVLMGSNAQGKTSVLEAIYFLAAFTSFQTHADRQIAVGRFYEKMIVVVHQTVRVADPIVSFIHVLDRIEKQFPVMVALKNRFLLIAEGSHVVDCARIFYAKGARHGESIAD